MIQARDISVETNAKALLKPCTISFQPGQFTAILGPNGAGKSTLLKALAGEYSSLDASILYHRQPLSQWDIQTRARYRAVVSQNTLLPFSYSVKEVVALALPYLPEPTLKHACAQFGLSEKLQQSYPTLSGGEQQRVQLARATCQLSSIPIDQTALLLDEPLSAQDLRYQLAIMSWLKEQAKEGQTVIAVLHDVKWAALFTDQVILMKDGNLIAQGPTAETLTEPMLETIYETPMTMAMHPTTKRLYPTPVI